ncbi:hypothetical protein JTE90_006022 [Oedothorax gibbosus]|nr:hypothetical protein JTE90_006022 [Oedothorax gibbosus]
MQISIVGSLLLWILAKWKRVGICLIIATGLGCNIALGVLTSLRKYPPAYAIYYYHRREEFEEPIYTAPLSHVLSYGIGMLLGYFMAKNKEVKFSKLHVVVGWVVSLALTVGVQWISFVWRDGREADPIWGAVYGATHRTAFSLGLSWIILACTYGYGGALARILCWRGFTVLSKLGYFGYLIHYIVISFHVSMARQPIPFSHYENWMRICSYTVLTFFAAYILYVTFELPLNYVESLFLPSRPPTNQTELPQNNNNNQQPKSDNIVPVHFNNVHNEKLGNGGIVPTYYATIPDEHSKL